MTPKSDTLFVSRRSVVQILMSVPALALFHESLPPTATAKPTRKAEGFVEVNGWILKRSEVA